LAAALHLAIQEPPGPVHVDLPEDVAQSAAIDTGAQSRQVVPLPDLTQELCQILSAALKKAHRPILVTGLTFTRSRAAEKLREFIERQKFPFVTTLHGKGFLPESHPNWAGVIGRARRRDVKALTDRADLIIAVGYDPIEINYEEWVGNRPVIHLSTEAAEVGGAVSFLWNKGCDFDRALDGAQQITVCANEWSASELSAMRSSLDLALRPVASKFAAHEVLDILRERLPANGILAYDVGAHTHQIASQWRTDHPRTLLATNGWSSMGFGMPAAYAAKLVFPDRAVVAVIGDGGFQMTAGELALARRLNLPVPVIVLNDGWLGLMKVKQERKNYPLSGVYLGPPPDSPTHYFGVPCRAARSPEEFRAALAWAFTAGGPTVIEAFIDVAPYSETVFD
jgi:acetolactate synthase I/II/III large subunit